MTATKVYDLRGQRALVTGAGRGIGEACAKTLAAVGAEVVLTARTEKQLEQVRDEIIKSGGKALVHAADIYSMEAVNNLKKLGPFNKFHESCQADIGRSKETIENSFNA